MTSGSAERAGGKALGPTVRTPGLGTGTSAGTGIDPDPDTDPDPDDEPEEHEPCLTRNWIDHD